MRRASEDRTDRARIPIFPTVIVLAAVLTMIALGFWQLGRLDEKEALIARTPPPASIPAVVCLLRRNC